MPRSFDRRAPGWLGLLGIVATSLGALGCPGNLDPSLLPGGSGTGGSSGTGGTGACDINSILTVSSSTYVACASASCHDNSVTMAAGLNLTLDSNVGSRLVNVMPAPNGTNGAVCGSIGKPLLAAASNPATGLLIDKITLANGNAALCPGGTAMPYPGIQRLSAAQQTCVEQWAEGLIMAAPAQ